MPANVDASAPLPVGAARSLLSERLWADPRGWALLALAAMLPFAFASYQRVKRRRGAVAAPVAAAAAQPEREPVATE